jgi:hypothetical protein
MKDHTLVLILNAPATITLQDLWRKSGYSAPTKASPFIEKCYPCGRVHIQRDWQAHRYIITLSGNFLEWNCARTLLDLIYQDLESVSDSLQGVILVLRLCPKTPLLQKNLHTLGTYELQPSGWSRKLIGSSEHKIVLAYDATTNVLTSAILGHLQDSAETLFYLDNLYMDLQALNLIEKGLSS